MFPPPLWRHLRPAIPLSPHCAIADPARTRAERWNRSSRSPSLLRPGRQRPAAEGWVPTSSRHDALTGERIPRPVPASSNLPVRHLRPSSTVAGGVRNADVAASPVVVVQVELRPCQDRLAAPGTHRQTGGDEGRIPFPHSLMRRAIPARLPRLARRQLALVKRGPVNTAIRGMRLSTSHGRRTYRIASPLTRLGEGKSTSAGCRGGSRSRWNPSPLGRRGSAHSSTALALFASTWQAGGSAW
jgi:hypothetical protein